MIGWNAEEACRICHVSKQKYNQSVWGAFLKVAELKLTDPLKTEIDMVVAMHEVIARTAKDPSDSPANAARAP
jgi:hypothetical protein